MNYSACNGIAELARARGLAMPRFGIQSDSIGGMGMGGHVERSRPCASAQVALVDRGSLNFYFLVQGHVNSKAFFIKFRHTSHTLRTHVDGLLAQLENLVPSLSRTLKQVQDHSELFAFYLHYYKNRPSPICLSALKPSKKREGQSPRRLEARTVLDLKNVRDLRNVP